MHMPNIIKPQELPKWVPGKLLSTSDNLGWNGIAQRSYRYQGQDVPIPPIDHYMIVRYSKAHTPMQRFFDGRWSKKVCSSGDLSLLTSMTDSHWHWTQEIDVDHVYLSNDLMSRVAGDALDRPIEEVFLHDLLQMQDPVLLSIVDAIHTETRDTGLGGALYAESLGMQLAIHLLRNYANVTFKDRESVGGLTPAQKRRLIEYIQCNIQQTIRMEDLAQVVGLGDWTFSRKFADSFNCSPHAYVTALRVEKARQMLMEGGLAIKEIAFDCGFSDQAHLTRVLRAKLGVTPGQLRRAEFSV